MISFNELFLLFISSISHFSGMSDYLLCSSCESASSELEVLQLDDEL